MMFLIYSLVIDDDFLYTKATFGLVAPQYKAQVYGLIRHLNQKSLLKPPEDSDLAVQLKRDLRPIKDVLYAQNLEGYANQPLIEHLSAQTLRVHQAAEEEAKKKKLHREEEIKRQEEVDQRDDAKPKNTSSQAAVWEEGERRNIASVRKGILGELQLKKQDNKYLTEQDQIKLDTLENWRILNDVEEYLMVRSTEGENIQQLMNNAKELLSQLNVSVNKSLEKNVRLTDKHQNQLQLLRAWMVLKQTSQQLKAFTIRDERKELQERVSQMQQLIGELWQEVKTALLEKRILDRDIKYKLDNFLRNTAVLKREIDNDKSLAQPVPEERRNLVDPKELERAKELADQYRQRNKAKIRALTKSIMLSQVNDAQLANAETGFNDIGLEDDTNKSVVSLERKKKIFLQMQIGPDRMNHLIGNDVWALKKLESQNSIYSAPDLSQLTLVEQEAIKLDMRIVLQLLFK